MVSQMREERQGKEGPPFTPPIPEHREGFDTETTTLQEPQFGWSDRTRHHRLRAGRITQVI